MGFIEELQYRKADPVNDLDYAYWNFFKPGIEDSVRELNAGEWPESRYDFFKKGFEDPDMQIILHNGEEIGCFCITESDEAIILQRVYIREDYQRRGIGGHLINMALDKAHETQKPLELEVLANNEKAINSYKKGGFVQTTDIIVNGWNQKFEMRHKDTEKYLRPASDLQREAGNDNNDTQSSFTKKHAGFKPK